MNLTAGGASGTVSGLSWGGRVDVAMTCCQSLSCNAHIVVIG